MAKRLSNASSIARRPVIAGGAAALLLAPILFTTPAYADPAPVADTLELGEGAGLLDVVVPDGVCAVNVTIGGGRGGLAIGEEIPSDDPDNPTPGDVTGTRGSGAQISAQLNLQAGQLLTLNVGGDGHNSGTGGLNGGGEGGEGGHKGGGGGGYTSVSVDGANLLLAGGGGGTGGGHNDGYGFGGNAGYGQNDSESVAGGTVYNADPGVSGWDGTDANDNDVLPGAGGGGTGTAGGAGGIHPTSIEDRNGTAGTSFQGGNGGWDGNFDTGGGGGSGFFGGGGGASTIGAGSYTGGGGGGGSSFVADSDLLSDVVLNDNRFTDEDGSSEGLAASAFATLDWVMCDYNLAVTKDVIGNAAFEDGGVVSYTVTVTNNGPDIMAVGDTVTLIDDLAAGGTLVSVHGLDTSIPEVGEEIPASGIELFDTIDLNTDPEADPNEVRRGLAVGDSVTVTYDVVVTGDEPVTNTVSVSDRNGEVSDNAVVDPAAPALELVKSADTETITEVGQKVTYSFLVTNTGNIDLHNISIEEGEFSGAGTLPAPTCPAEPVAPGDNVTCTSVYTAVKGDLTGDDLENTAVAHAETPMGAPVESEASEASITTVKPVPAVAVSGLATTGSEGASWAALGALALLGAGAITLTARALNMRNKVS